MTWIFLATISDNVWQLSRILKHLWNNKVLVYDLLWLLTLKNYIFAMFTAALVFFKIVDNMTWIFLATISDNVWQLSRILKHLWNNKVLVYDLLWLLTLKNYIWRYCKSLSTRSWVLWIPFFCFSPVFAADVLKMASGRQGTLKCLLLILYLSWTHVWTSKSVIFCKFKAYWRMAYRLN